MLCLQSPAASAASAAATACFFAAGTGVRCIRVQGCNWSAVSPIESCATSPSTIPASQVFPLSNCSGWMSFSPLLESNVCKI